MTSSTMRSTKPVGFQLDDDLFVKLGASAHERATTVGILARAIVTAALNGDLASLIGTDVLAKSRKGPKPKRSKYDNSAQEAADHARTIVRGVEVRRRTTSAQVPDTRPHVVQRRQGRPPGGIMANTQNTMPQFVRRGAQPTKAELYADLARAVSNTAAMQADE